MNADQRFDPVSCASCSRSYLGCWSSFRLEVQVNLLIFSICVASVAPLVLRVSWCVFFDTLIKHTRWKHHQVVVLW